MMLGRTSNALPSCSYTTTTRSFASAAASRPRPRGLLPRDKVTKKQRDSNGYKPFVDRLSARQEQVLDASGSRRKWNERKTGMNLKGVGSLTVRGLKPFEVVDRINQLVKEDRLDAAISMVENLPLDTVNVVVWNVLISNAIKAERYKLAFELYYDMKRRHISPNTRTFATLFVGLSRISNWDSYSNILARVHTAYTQLLAHFAALSVSNPTSPDIAPWPINGYLNLLSKTHDWPRIWDTFFGMQGRWKPDEVTYTLLLKALQARKSLSKAPNARGNEETEHIIDMKEWEAQYDLSSVPEEPSFETEIETGEPSLPLSISYQNASDARLVWEHLLRANKTDPQTAPINAHHLAPLIHLLAFGRPSDWELGWEVVERYLAVEHPLPKLRTKPRPKTEPAGEGAIAPGGRPVPVPLNQSLLTSLFNLSLQSGHTEYVIETFQSLASSPTKKQILNSSHLALVMYAFSLRRAPKGQVSDAREAIGVLEWILKEGDERARLRRRRIGDEGAGGDGPLLGWLKVSQKHFEYALVSAWKAVDFPAALRVFELITGLDRARFMTSIPTSAPSSDPSGPKRTRWKDRSSGSASASAPLKIKERHEGCKWDTEPMHLLVKTALATGRSNDLKVALRIFERLGIAHFFGPSENLEVLKGQKELASAVSRALKIVQRAAGDMRAEEPEKRMWERIGGAVGNLTKRLNKNVAEREEDELAERTKEKAKSMVEMKEENGKTVIQDEGVQLVVSLKGRKSEWSEGL